MNSLKINKNSTEYLITTFYVFRPLKKITINHLKDLLTESCHRRKVKGTILLAYEGVNGTICGSPESIEKTISLLENNIPRDSLDKKISWSKKQVFNRLKIKIKKEIVTIGIPEVDPRKTVGSYVEPTHWNEFIEDPETLVIDTRNKYEIGIGSFKNSLNPNTDNFRDFPDWVQNNLKPIVNEKPPKRIAMFCTGGIRCEKATSYLIQEGFQNIHHLHGGILKYLEEIPPEKSLWEGECFVFDQRVALNHSLKKGIYSLCHACGSPLSPEDIKSQHYIRGVQCNQCIDRYTYEDRKRFAERQLQIEQYKQKLGEKDV